MPPLDANLGRIHRILSNAAFKAETSNKIGLWHARLGYPGTTILRRMILLLDGHALCTSDAKKVGSCSACFQGKFNLRALKWKLPTELPLALERLQGDVCSPIVPSSSPFSYFFVLVDAFDQYVDVSLLSTRNLVFPKLLAMFIELRTHYLDVYVKHL